MVGKKTKPKSIKLNERDVEVLEHVYRYRMTVPEALVHQCFVESLTAAKNLLRRLRYAGYLQSAPLFGTKSYCFLTKRACLLLEQSENAARSLPEQTKLDSFAMLCFCAMREPYQHKLTLDEFKENFPKLFRNGERPNYYVDSTTERKRLGFIRVDRGGFGRWDRLLGRCLGDITTRSDLPEFRSLIDKGGFVFTLLTALPQKRERLEAAIPEKPFPCEINVVAIPEILELVAPLPK